MSKMVVRLLVSRAGVSFSQSRGDEIEIDSDEGERMISAHQCTFISGERGAAPAEPESSDPDSGLVDVDGATDVSQGAGVGGAPGDGSVGASVGFESEGVTSEGAVSEPMAEVSSSKKKS